MHGSASEDVWKQAVHRGLLSNDFLIIVRIAEQRLELLQHDKLLVSYPVSTSRHGTGFVEHSHRTPTGWHEVAEWIGDGLPIGSALKARQPTGIVVPENEWVSDTKHDTILTRIMWLAGLEKGVNQGHGVDTHQRFIYIHGTSHEQEIGRPASGGCVRMRNRDVLDLFSRTKNKSTWVWIG